MKNTILPNNSKDLNNSKSAKKQKINSIDKSKNNLISNSINLDIDNNEQNNININDNEIETNKLWPYSLNRLEELNLLKEYYLNTDYKYINKYICCVCSRFYLLKNNSLKTNYNILVKNRNLLHKNRLYDIIQENEFNYNNFQELNDLILNKKGLYEEDKTVNICSECLTSLKNSILPKYALANNLYVGESYVDLKELTIVEQSLIARNYLKLNIIKISKNYQYKSKGNIITFSQNPDNLTSILPNIGNYDSIFVCFVGVNEPNYDLTKKLLRVRKEKVIKSLLLLKKININYKDVQISTQLLDNLPEDDIPTELKLNFSITVFNV